MLAIFDSNVSNRPATDPHSKTTSELQSPTSYAGIYADWNVDVDEGLASGVDDATMPGDATPDDPWDFGTNSEYPVLKYIDTNGDGTIDDIDLAMQRAALPVVPSAPLNVVVEAVTETSVSLSWDAYTGATGFEVYYSTSSGFDPSAAVPEGTEFPNSLSGASEGVVVTGLTAGTTYYLRVAAVDGATVGTYAAEVTAMTTAANSPNSPNFPNFIGTQDFALYPNPAQSAVRIGGLMRSIEYKYSIYTLSGEQVLGGVLSKAGLVRLDYLPSGQYIFVLDNGEGMVFRSPLLLQ